MMAINIKMNQETITSITYYNPPSQKVSENVFEIIKTHKLNLNAKRRSLGCRVNIIHVIRNLLFLFHLKFEI